MKILVSNNSELLRHLAAYPFRSLPIEVTVATGGLRAVEMARKERPVLAMLDAEMTDLSGYDASKAIKEIVPECRVVLVLGVRISARQMRLVTESACDEVLIAPMGADQLYDVVAIQLKLPRRGALRYRIDLAVLGREGQRPIAGRVTNLSVDGARLVLSEPIAEDAALRLDIRLEGEPPIAIDARVVWAQGRDDGTVVGASFEGISPEARRQLARLTQWDLIQGAERTRVVLKGDITEATQFDDLLPALVGKIDFDLSQVTYMNSIGVREWIEFLDRVSVEDYEFHACSVAFVMQASLVDGVLGHGRVVSFFAPYACVKCDEQEERLLQSAAVLGSEEERTPVFSCSRCDGQLVLDDIPARYLAFLDPRPIATMD